LHGSGQASETLVGFAADLSWVQQQPLPECRRQLGLDKFACVLLAADGKPGGEATASEARLAFKRLFAPFWALSVGSGLGQARSLQAGHDLLVFGGATLLLAGVLALGVLMRIRDVTREMQLNRLRSDLVAGVSHELKTPLTLIRLYGETLLYGEGFSGEERQNYCQIITRESERLSHLIENVLDFSRIERGQKQYRLQAGDLGPVSATTVAPYRDYLQRQGFTPEADLATSLPPVCFDADAVTEAVLNLIDNAAKYSGESKLIAVRLRPQASRVVFEAWASPKASGTDPSSSSASRPSAGRRAATAWACSSSNTSWMPTAAARRCRARLAGAASFGWLSRPPLPQNSPPKDPNQRRSHAQNLSQAAPQTDEALV
jgi:signal transduction histidine kinase